MDGLRTVRLTWRRGEAECLCERCRVWTDSEGRARGLDCGRRARYAIDGGMDDVEPPAFLCTTHMREWLAAERAANRGAYLSYEGDDDDG